MWHTCVGGNQISLTPYRSNSGQKMKKNSTNEYKYDGSSKYLQINPRLDFFSLIAFLKNTLFSGFLKLAQCVLYSRRCVSTIALLKQIIILCARWERVGIRCIYFLPLNCNFDLIRFENIKIYAFIILVYSTTDLVNSNLYLFFFSSVPGCRILQF